MGDQDSLSVLQALTQNSQQQQTQNPTQPQAPNSLAVLQQISNNTPVTMVGPKGEKTQVSTNDVASMRQKNYAISPDTPGAQQMVTADGKIAYVLPNEVTNFEDNGATQILPDGRFLVKNLRSDGSEFPDSIPDVRERAVNIAKALGDDQMKKSVAAEQKYWTSKEGLKEEAKGLGNVALVGGGTMAALAAPAVAARVFAPSVVPVAGGVGFGGAAAGEVAGPSLASQAATWVGRQLLAHGTKIIGGGLPTTALITKLLHWW